MDLTGMLQAAAGAAGEENLYIEDVFSTYLYTGNGSTQTITNGIDLDGEGGLVWIKNREEADSHILTDTERGATEILSSDSSAAEATDADTLTAFNSDGFAIGADDKVNTNTENFVSWTFRKAPKFFDIVTYTGDDVNNRTISHNLGSTPGCIIVKRLNGVDDWIVYHRSTPNGFNLFLNKTNGEQTSPTFVIKSATATTFTVGTTSVNDSGGTYVAYLFAHDAGGFGDDGTDNVISCENYTGNGSATGPTVTLGYEPQWLMIKRTDSTGDWIILDSKRDVSNPRDAYLEPNTSDAEATGNDVDFNSTSFQLKSTSATVNANGGTYIYVVIRADML